MGLHAGDKTFVEVDRKAGWLYVYDAKSGRLRYQLRIPKGAECAS